MKKLLMFMVLLLAVPLAFATLNNSQTYYSFDNANISGSNPLDLSGNANTGTNINATTGVNGKLGEAFLFNRVSGSRIQLNEISSPTGYTIAAWFNATSLPTTGQYYFISGNGENENGIALKNSAGTQQISAYHTTSSSAGAELAYTITLNTSQWYHIASTWDGSFLRLYLNGQEVLSGSRTNIKTGGTSQSNIGNWLGGVSHTFNGSIDEWVYYNTSKNASVIAELYNNGTGINPYAPPAPPAPTTSYANITARNSWNASTISNFSAAIEYSNPLFSNITNISVGTPLALSWLTMTTQNRYVQDIYTGGSSQIGRYNTTTGQWINLTNNKVNNFTITPLIIYDAVALENSLTPYVYFAGYNGHFSRYYNDEWYDLSAGLNLTSLNIRSLATDNNDRVFIGVDDSVVPYNSIIIYNITNNSYNYISTGLNIVRDLYYYNNNLYFYSNNNNIYEYDLANNILTAITSMPSTPQGLVGVADSLYYINDNLLFKFNITTSSSTNLSSILPINPWLDVQTIATDSYNVYLSYHDSEITASPRDKGIIKYNIESGAYSTIYNVSAVNIFDSFLISSTDANGGIKLFNRYQDDTNTPIVQFNITSALLTTNGTINTNILVNSTEAFDITVTSPSYLQGFYNNYNFSASGNLIANLSPLAELRVRNTNGTLYNNFTAYSAILNDTYPKTVTLTNTRYSDPAAFLNRVIGNNTFRIDYPAYYAVTINTTGTGCTVPCININAQIIGYNGTVFYASFNGTTTGTINVYLPVGNYWIQPWVGGTYATELVSVQLYEDIYNGTIVLPYALNQTGTDTLTFYGQFGNRTVSYTPSTQGNYLLNVTDSILYLTSPSELYTNTNISGGHFVVNGSNQSAGTPFALNRGIYWVAYNNPNYVQKNITINLTSYGDVLYQMTDIGNVLFNVTTWTSSGGALLANISITPNSYIANATNLTNSYGSNVTLMNGSYTIRAAADGYIPFVGNYTFAAGYPTLRINLTLDNNFTFFVYNEETLLSIPNATWILYEVSENTVGRNGTANGTSFNLEGLENGLYELRYWASGYQPRSYFINVPAVSVTDVNISLYSLINTSGTSFLVKTTDKFNQFVSDITVSMLRRYVVNNQTVFYVVEQNRPLRQYDGQSVFFGVPNNVPYLFRVTDSAGTVLYQGSGTTENNRETLYIITNQLYIKLDPTSDLFRSYQSASTASVSLTNTSNTFWMSFSNVQNEFDEICLQVRKNNNEVLDEQCATQDSGIISYTIPTLENNTFYVAEGILRSDTIGEVTTDIAVIDNTLSRSEAFGFMGVLLTILMVILFAVGFANKPSIMILMISLAIISSGSWFLGVTAIGLVTQGTLLVVGVIVAYLLRDD